MMKWIDAQNIGLFNRFVKYIGEMQGLTFGFAL